MRESGRCEHFFLIQGYERSPVRDRDSISTLMPMYRRIGTALLHPLETVLCILLVAIVVLIFAQVVTRYLLHVSLSWSEELARYLLMWLAMLSAAYGFKIKAHFALVFLVNRFPEGTRRVISLAVALLVCALLCLFVLKAVEITWSVRRQTGPATGMSKAFPYSSGIVGGLLMLHYVARNAWRDWRARNREVGRASGA